MKSPITIILLIAIIPLTSHAACETEWDAYKAANAKAEKQAFIDFEKTLVATYKKSKEAGDNLVSIEKKLLAAWEKSVAALKISFADFLKSLSDLRTIKRDMLISMEATEKAKSNNIPAAEYEKIISEFFERKSDYYEALAKQAKAETNQAKAQVNQDKTKNAYYNFLSPNYIQIFKASKQLEEVWKKCKTADIQI